MLEFYFENNNRKIHLHVYLLWTESGAITTIINVTACLKNVNKILYETLDSMFTCLNTHIFYK